MQGRTASVFAPASAQASALSELSTVLVIGAAVIFAVVMVPLLMALRRHGRGQGAATAWWVWGGGVIFPVVVLSALLVYSTVRTAGLDSSRAAPDLVVSVTGRLWWWELRYRDPATGRDLFAANELRLPVGRTVQLGMQSANVIHSLWVPELGGKMDLVPGRMNRLVITPTQTGTFRGQCAEFCGTQHSRMALHVVVMPAQDFDAWLAELAQPARRAVPETGRQAFVDHGCAACHSVDAGSAEPPRGPNLAQVSLRRHLGAGLLVNGPGAYKRWLVGVQTLKPGAQMPSYAHLDGSTLDALAGYLESLK